MIRVGVLSIQGSVKEHLDCLKKIPDAFPVACNTNEAIKNVDALIIPGGESTAIGKILKEYNIVDSILYLHALKRPIWGTCAGMVLIAKEIDSENGNHIGIMDINVKRNAYGGQLDSFVAKEIIPEVSDKTLDLVFIRAPYITEVGENVKILCKYNDRIVAAREGSLLATSFHPELTKDLSFYNYFMSMI